MYYSVSCNFFSLIGLNWKSDHQLIFFQKWFDLSTMNFICELIAQFNPDGYLFLYLLLRYFWLFPSFNTESSSSSVTDRTSYFDSNGHHVTEEWVLVLVFHQSQEGNHILIHFPSRHAPPLMASVGNKSSHVKLISLSRAIAIFFNQSPP